MIVYCSRWSVYDDCLLLLVSMVTVPILLQNTGIRQERSVILLTPEPCSDKRSKLESRIEQQSELISLMKRRSDDMIHEVSEYIIGDHCNL